LSDYPTVSASSETSKTGPAERAFVGSDSANGPVNPQATGGERIVSDVETEPLSASEASYRAIFELASDAMFVHDIETGAILAANRKACELHGFTLEEM